MIRILLYGIIFYFTYRLIVSMFRPKHAGAGHGRNGSSPGNPRQKVTIQYDREKARSKVADDVGEYVDFEEVKEEKKS
jgi:hypothetical protein